MLRGHKPRDIYNADERGLFFRTLPRKTLPLKSEKCIGGQLSKERLADLFSVNISGEKQPTLVIGKQPVLEH